MSNEIDLYSKLNDPIQAVEKFGAMFFASGMFGCETEEQGQVLAFMCISERKSPGDIMKNNHIIKGRLTRRADSLLAEFRERGGKYYIIEHSDTRAAARFVYRENDQTLEFTYAQADKEGLTRPDKNGESQYKKRPAPMLWARLISNMQKMMMPEAGTGTYPPEVVETFDDVQAVEVEPIDVTPSYLDELVRLLAPFEREANELFLLKGYIQPGQTFRALSPEKAASLLAKPAPVMNKLAKMHEAAAAT